MTQKIDEKILILIEETGCQKKEAELALQLSNYNVESAIYTIRSMLKDIAVIKGKFIVQEQNLYGVFIIIVNKRNENIIRIRSVVSYDPHIYETNINSDWYDVEKIIYFYRLQKGVIQTVVYETDKYFNTVINKNIKKLLDVIEEKNIDRIGEILFENFLFGGDCSYKINTQELNLIEYQHGKMTINQPQDEKLISELPSNKVFLQTKLIEDKKGKRVSKLSKGNIVFAQITDTRDIAKYLLKLLGTKEDLYLSLPVDNIIKTDKNEIEIHLFLGSNIVGVSKMHPNVHIKMVKEDRQNWLKKLLGLK